MAVGDIYIRFKDAESTRTELCCLARYLFDYIEEFRIKTEDDENRIPRGFYLLQRVYPKPDIPEGKEKGYHFKIEEGVMKRYYLICSGSTDKQLLVVDDYEEAVQNFLDDSVMAKGYDSVYTCLSYKGDPDPIFSAEADAVLTWRSTVWRTAQGILNRWMQGEIEQPTIQEVIAQLPTLTWPNQS